MYLIHHLRPVGYCIMDIVGNQRLTYDLSVLYHRFSILRRIYNVRKHLDRRITNNKRRYTTTTTIMMIMMIMMMMIMMILNSRKRRRMMLMLMLILIMIMMMMTMIKYNDSNNCNRSLLYGKSSKNNRINNCSQAKNYVPGCMYVYIYKGRGQRTRNSYSYCIISALSFSVVPCFPSHSRSSS